MKKNSSTAEVLRTMYTMDMVHFISQAQKPSHILVGTRMVLDMGVVLNLTFKEIRFIKERSEMTNEKEEEKSLMNKETKYIAENGQIICVMALVLHISQRGVNTSVATRII